MEIWLGDLSRALERLEYEYGNLCQYVSSIQGAYHGIIFCFTSGEIVKYDLDKNEIVQMKGEWA